MFLTKPKERRSNLLFDQVVLNCNHEHLIKIIDRFQSPPRAAASKVLHWRMYLTPSVCVCGCRSDMPPKSAPSSEFENDCLCHLLTQMLECTSASRSQTFRASSSEIQGPDSRSKRQTDRQSSGPAC